MISSDIVLMLVKPFFRIMKFSIKVTYGPLYILLVAAYNF